MSEQETKVRQFGRYELINQIAVGGMGEIYLARSRGAHGFEKRLVIKKILPYLANESEFVSKFVDEAKIVTELTHGNIVPVFDMGEIEGEYYIAMEFIAGRDLREILKVCKARTWLMPIKTAVFIMAETCKGLDYAHHKKDGEGRDLNIIHRDISPSNILISTEGEVKLVDFGIAKATNKTTRSVTNQLQGKFCYMSPEQATGKVLDKRSDLFSVGVCLYEMLTNTRPFEGRNDLDSLERIRAHMPPPPSELRPDIPEEIDAIVMQALSKSATDRYDNSDEMARAMLTWLFANGGITSREASASLLDIFPDGLERQETRGTSTLTPVQRLSIDDLMRVELEKMLGNEGGGGAPSTGYLTPASAPRLSSQDGRTPTASASVAASLASGDALPAARLDGKSETVSIIHAMPATSTSTGEQIRIGEEGIAPEEIHKIGHSVTAPLTAISVAEAQRALTEANETSDPQPVQTPRYGVETPVGLIIPAPETTTSDTTEPVAPPETKPPPETETFNTSTARTEPEPVASPGLFERPIVRRSAWVVAGIVLAGLGLVGYNGFFAPASLLIMTSHEDALITVEGQGQKYTATADRHEFKDLPKGMYTITVEGHGDRKFRDVDLSASERGVLQFVLIPPKKPPVVAETRNIRIETVPEGATVFLGNKSTGKKTPAEIEILKKGGIVKLVLKDKNSEKKHEIFIGPNETTAVYKHDFNAVAAIEPDAGTVEEADVGNQEPDTSVGSTSTPNEETQWGTVNFTSNPSGATVYVANKKLKDVTPTFTRLPIGTFGIRFQLKGHKPTTKLARITKKGDRFSVSVNLEPEKAKEPEVPKDVPTVSVTLTARKVNEGSPTYCSSYIINGKSFNSKGVGLTVQLPLGTHSVKAHCAGGFSGKKTIKVVKGGKTYTTLVQRTD